ncbi:MAG: transcriptional repressor LexA [Candidatus Parcubacteria bacterium]|jgi:repressor LexA|nr:MAG: transcriptional repressor LexA [Candidatus Parcubacteria bacterium]
MPTLTKKQKEVYDFIEDQIDENGYAPSLPEIRDHFQISAVSTVHEHVTALVKKGFLKRAKNVSRSLELVGQRLTDMMEVPLVGTITAGKPIEAIEIPDQVVEIAKDRRFQEGELYALKVHGNSMIGDGIFDGDFAIIKKQDYAADGDTVVAVIDDNEATLKRFYREKDRIRLQPANPTFSPIYRKDVEIRGIVVKIIREFGHH